MNDWKLQFPVNLKYKLLIEFPWYKQNSSIMIGAKGKQIFNFATYYNTVCILKLLVNTMKIWNSFSGLYPWRTSPDYYQIVFKKTTDTLDSLSLVNPSDDHVMIPGKLPVCLWFQVKKVFAVLGYGQKSSRDSEMSDIVFPLLTITAVF